MASDDRSNTRFVFILSIHFNHDTFETDIAIDSLHRVKTPVFPSEQMFDFVSNIDPTLGKYDFNVIKWMDIRTRLNPSHLHGPLMVTLPVKQDIEDSAVNDLLVAHLSAMNEKSLYDFVKQAAV